MYSEWLETKKQFRIGLIASSIIVFALLIWPGNKINTSNSEFIKENVILDSKPIFCEERHGKNIEYFVKLKFKDNTQEFRITGMDYDFLKYNDFLKINSGDTLKIERTSNKIHSLVKNNIDYLNYTKAETNRGLTIYFFGFLLIPMIPYCLFIQFLKKRPSFSFNNRSYEVPFNIVTLLIFITTIILLLNVMPEFQIIAKGEFYK